MIIVDRIKYAKLQARRSAATAAVYRGFPMGTPWDHCLANCGEAERATWVASLEACRTFEQKLMDR